MDLGPCKRDNTNIYVYSPTCVGFICYECVRDGMYNEQVTKEILSTIKESKDGSINSNKEQ